MIWDTWNFGLGFPHDSRDLELRKVLIWVCCIVIYGANHVHVELNCDLGSNNGDLEVHLIEHELKFLWSCMI